MLLIDWLQGAFYNIEARQIRRQHQICCKRILVIFVVNGYQRHHDPIYEYKATDFRKCNLKWNISDGTITNPETIDSAKWTRMSEQYMKAVFQNLHHRIFAQQLWNYFHCFPRKDANLISITCIHKSDNIPVIVTYEIIWYRSNEASRVIFLSMWRIATVQYRDRHDRKCTLPRRNIADIVYYREMTLLTTLLPKLNETDTHCCSMLLIWNLG